MKSILLIEDNADSRTVYRLALEHYGYRVFEATNGEAGVALAEQRVPDLILLDLGLPGMTGYEVAIRLRNSPATARIPIVAVSAHVFSDHQDLALRSGCDAFLPKPIEPRALHAALGRWLNGS